MKLRAIHLFFILIGSLILCCLICSCFPSREGMKGSRDSTGDVALDVQNAGEKQAKNDYTDYQAELAREGLSTDKDYTPNNNYPASNIGGDPSTWSPTKMSKNIGGDPATWSPTNVNNNSSNSGSVIGDIENTFKDAGKDINNLFTGNTSSTTQNGYTTTTSSKNQPVSSYTGPAGDTVDVYSSDANIPWYDSNSSSSSSSNNTSSATATTYTGSQGNTATTYTGPQGNSATVVNNGGIYASQIPSGDEDLYILKSQIVPPVCPACPSSATCPRQEPCQPCPPCARCPEPSFECKKVPNYAANNDQYLPRPVLNDFSSFGM